MNPTIIGVRHFSPACARLVVERIRALRPRYVLIEGPADFNSRLGELALPHRLPLAIYSYASGSGDADTEGLARRASWSPFSEHAPEWQAMQAAREVGAHVRFIDLPAWHDAFAETLNRYADATDSEHAARARNYEQALCRAMAIDGSDALWDHLFEGDLATEELATRLETYFINLRADDPGSNGNQAREAMMARYIAWAVAQQAGPVLVVCGGYHAPALSALWQQVPQALCTDEPQAKAPVCAVDHGSYLVPYHAKRLDAFTGYASGMSSPAYYEWVWRCGVAGAGAMLLKEVLTRLRHRKLGASTSDVIAIHARATGLARMRAHAAPLRCDWLDAMAGSLVKQALDVPLPWTYRGPIRAGTDPYLVQIMDVMAGDAVGRLAPGTPQPPLVTAVEAELAALGIAIPGTLTLNLLDPLERPRSQALHRLALLDIPGVVRSSGPSLALGSGQQECWSLKSSLEQRAALIEASIYGATLVDAARARLEEILAQDPGGANRIGRIADALNRAAFAGLASISARLLDELHVAVGSEARFEALGQPLEILYSLYRYGESLGMHGSVMLHTVIEAAFDRALWLLEGAGPVAAQDQAQHIDTFLSLATLVRDAMAHEPVALLADLQPQRALAVCQRTAASQQAAPVSRGAALGLLLCTTEQAGTSALASDLLASLPPQQMGDALSGMLAVGRQHLTDDAAFISAFDQQIRSLDDATFIAALPSVRAAFAWLPTHERGALAATVLKLHDAADYPTRVLTGSLGEFAAPVQAAHAALERAAIARLAAWGIAL